MNTNILIQPIVYEKTDQMKIFFPDVGYLAPKPDITPYESVLINAVLARSTVPLQTVLDYKKFFSYHGLLRHFTDKPEEAA